MRGKSETPPPPPPPPPQKKEEKEKKRKSRLCFVLCMQASNRAHTSVLKAPAKTAQNKTWGWILSITKLNMVCITHCHLRATIANKQLWPGAVTVPLKGMKFCLLPLVFGWTSAPGQPDRTLTMGKNSQVGVG